ncbi:MAG: hypothetical protein K2G82_06925, partial [Paramuribaculum sp.]|nr:hypothetical protein [Paramuribaculum sp.]
MGVNSTLLKEKGITYTPISKDPDILSISTTAGIPNDITLTVQSTGTTWGAPDDPNENTSIRANSVKSGTYPAFVFDGISFIVPSDTPNPPLKPTAKTDLDDAASSGGVWHSARPFTLTLAAQTDDYDNHKIEYIISETSVDELDWTSAKEYTTPLSIEKSCYVYARILSTYEGKTYPSAVETVVASILNPIKIADLADLHKADNDGKVVMLQMPLMVRGNCKMNVQGADAAKKFTNVVYARDVNGIAVKLISRRNKSEETAFPSLLSYNSPTKDKINLLPINTIVGKYRYNDGVNPEIVIRDLTSAPADDYYNYQGTESSVEMTLNGNDYQGLNFISAQKLATDEEYTDLTDGLFGKIVILRGLANWNATENTFELSESADKKTIKIRSGANVEGSLSAGSGHTVTAWNPTLTGLSSDKEYSAIVAVEYDPTDHNYYFAPCEFQESFEKPELIIPEAEKDKYQVIKDENNKISEIIYTDEFLNGNISLSFSITKPSALPSTAYYYPALKREDGSAVITPDNVNTNTFKLDFTTKQLTFDEETGAATVYASAYCKGNYNTTHDGHPLKITIRDAVQTGPEVVSIEEFRTKMQKGELSADKPVYVRFSGRFAVVARNGNVLQLRDVDKDLPLNPANASDTVTVFKDSYILVHENDGWKQTYQKNPQTNVKERTGFPVLYQSNGMYGWEAYSKEIAIGEEITQFIGKVTIDEAGNYDIDLTGLGNFFTSWSLYLYHDDGYFENLDKLAVSGYKAGTPRFIPYMVSRDLDGNPVTDEQGNLVMREENCVNRPVSYALSSLDEHPDNHPENIKLNDDLLDAQMKVMKVQVKKADTADDYTAQFTADGVMLLWDMFGT